MRRTPRGGTLRSAWLLPWMLASACQAPASDAERSPHSGQAASSTERTPEHTTTIAIPASLRGLPTGRTGTDGEPIVTPCMTCHAGRDAGVVLLPPSSALRGPHAGFTLQHGDNTCASCHDAARRDLLHLADGTRIELVEALSLCGQCHGLQRRDYLRGAHGGMNGYWDLRAGPRTRNHCVHCHDPHRPKYPRLLPAPPPRDRFFGRAGKDNHG